MNNYAYIHEKPEDIQYKSGDLKVRYYEKGETVSINNGNVIISISDIDWLCTVLKDIKEISEMTKGEGK